MKHRSHGVVLSGALFAAVVAAGCAEHKEEKLEAPPRGGIERPSQFTDDFIYMADNAMMQNSAIGDSVFVPHTAELNGLGVKRLTRMVEALSVCGGTINYATDSRDQKLIEQRLSAMRDYLASFGDQAKNIQVELGLSRGRGSSAEQAIAARDKAFKESEAGGAGAAAGAGGAAAGAGATH